jgi:hypothetical protein
VTGSQAGRALFCARSLAFDAGGKKKQDALTTSPPPPSPRPLPPIPQVSFTKLCHHGVLQDRLPVSIWEFVAQELGVSARAFLFSLRCTQRHWRKRRFFSFWLAFLCSAVFLETRDTSAKVTSSLAFALVLHQRPSFVISVSFRADRWEELDGMTVAASGRSELVERERKRES